MVLFQFKRLKVQSAERTRSADGGNETKSAVASKRCDAINSCREHSAASPSNADRQDILRQPTALIRERGI
jgi:hypothetical protein